MATLDDSPSLYLGQQWTHWAEKVEGKSKNDHPAPKEECCSKDDGDTIKLRHQDMPLYGLCPARDEFYLVVCECCEQVVKPQALKRHIEQRHGHTSPRPSTLRKSKGSPGRHSGSPARHSGSPGRRSSPKRESHGKTPPINPPGVKSSSKSGGSSHRSSASNTKSKKSNHAMPVVKVERIQPSAMVSKSNSSPSTKTANTKHEHNEHKDHKHDKDYREHHKDHREHSKDHKHDKEHKEHREKDRDKDHREHHKDHREHSREHKDKDHKHDKEHKDYKEKDHSKEKEHKEHTKDRDHRERDRDKEAKEKEHKQDRDRDRDRDRDHNKEKDHRDKDHSRDRDRDHKDKHDREHREKDRDHKEKEHHKEHRDHKDHKDHKDHREKKSNLSSSGSSSQSTSSVTPPRPSSSQKNSTSIPSPSTPSNSSNMASPSSVPGKPAKFIKEKMLPCKDREFDANKHCGVWIPEIARQCTRSLTCKTHALSLRRAVKGRRKPFDELLKEHRAAKELLLKWKAEEKEAAAAGKNSSSTSPAVSSNSKSSSASGSQHRDSARESSSAASSAAKAAAISVPMPKPSKAPPKVTSPPPSRPAPPPAPPPREEPSGPADSSSRLSSDAEDDDDDRDRLGYPQLSYHPRPAAMNSFGARCFSGSSCIVFNRRADLLRAAFHACVERYLHPPPHKKLCVESKLPEGSHIATNSQDPYDFPTMDMGSLTTNGLASGLGSPTSSHNSSLISSWNSNKLSNKVKQKSSSATLSSSAAGRNIRPKDLPSGKGGAITSPVAMVIGGPASTPLSPPLTTVTPISRTVGLAASSGGLTNSITGVKRKRSGSGTGAGTGGLTMHQLPAGLTVNHHNTSTGNPISISIPSGSLNLANLTQAQLNHIVMTSRDPGVMNGQLITSTAMPTSAIADITSLQLNSLSGETNTAVPTQQTHKQKKEKRLKLSHGVSASLNSSHMDGVGATVSTLTSLPGGVLVMPDLTGQQTTFTQGFGSTGLLSSSADLSATKLSSSTTSPLFASGSTSPQTSASSPLANGLFGHGLELKGKGLPVNHVAGAMMVSPGSASSTPSPSTTSLEQHRSSSSKTMRLGSVSSRKSSGPRSKSHRSQQLAPQVASSQQLTAAAITLATPGNRLLPMYTMDASSGQFQQIQIQPKAGGKQTLASGKLSMQPVSLTIPMSGVATMTSPQQQTHATLLLQNDDHHSGAHHAAAAQQLQNSPSNVLS